MIKLVYGCFGSGKSRYIANEIIRSLEKSSSGTSVMPKSPLLIVPESSLVITERLIADIAGDVPTEGLEVLSFRRLANRVFREAGGLCYNYVNEGGKKIILWRAICSVNHSLVQYKDLSINDKKILELILSVITELMRSGVTPKMLEEASEKIAEDKIKLKNKLLDIALIYSAYQTLLHEKYDDPEEDLNRLCTKLDNYDFFSDKEVYIDSFASLTQQENEVLRRIIRSCDVTISINRATNDNRDFLQKVMLWEKKIFSIARQEGVEVTVERDFAEPIKFTCSSLSHLSKNLWQTLPEKSNTEDFGLEIIECETPYDEVEAAAKKILSHVQNGGRFYDCAVTCGSTERYSTLCHSIFTQHGIPFFLSEKEPLKIKSLVRLILLALDIKIYYYRMNDILSYIKTGLCGIDEADSFLLEQYVLTWKIEGRRWSENFIWNMNPDGLSEELTENGIRILNKVNELKNQVIFPLLSFFEVFNEVCNVQGVCIALYNFLCELDIPSKLDKLSKDAFASGDYALSQEYKSIWGCVCDALDELVNAAGDMPCNPEQFKTLFLAILDGKEIGKIPTTVDEVLVTDALSIRADRTKLLNILGVNDGVFPRKITENSFFSDRDKEELMQIGIELQTDSETLTADEQYLFAYALSVPRENLIITYATKGLQGEEIGQSAEIAQITDLFDNFTIQKYAEADLRSKIYGENATFLLAAKEKDKVWSFALNSYFSEKEEFRDRLTALETPLAKLQENLNTDISVKKTKSLTPSRIESFVYCPLAYNCKYVLKLSEEKSAEPKVNHAGIIMHKILENFMRRVICESESGEMKTDYTEEEICRDIDDTLNEYYKKTCNASLSDDNDNRNPELEMLFKKLKRTAFYIIENLLYEFRQSEFVPSMFEQKIGLGGEDSLNSLEINLNDGSSVKISGIIDRVDIYKKGNDIYFRIVDYKTGDKKLILEDVRMGINLQMLLYLFSIWKGDNTTFLEKVGAGENDRLHPAGIIYYIAKIPSSDCGKLMSREEAVATLGNVAKSGMLINDMEILRAMEKNLEGKFIHVYLKKRSAETLVGLTQSEGGFEQLLNEITEIISQITDKIRSGNANATPLKYKQHDACKYCKMKPVCRFENNGESAEEEVGDED